MTDNKGYKLTTQLKVEFKRKNKIYIKDIFIIMNEKMKKNIMEKDNIQYFADTTYDAVLPHNSHMKLSTSYPMLEVTIINFLPLNI